MSAATEAENASDLEPLLVRYQQGDRTAAATLVSLVSPALLRYCLGQGDPPQDAEDLLQEIWLRIHKARHTYRPGEPAAPWLYAIARHTRVDAFRRRRRTRAREVTVEELPDAAAAPAPLAEESRFTAILAQLPEGEREVLTMLKGLGMTLAEVAGATGATVGAVKQKSHRAYKRLRALLASSAMEPRP